MNIFLNKIRSWFYFNIRLRIGRLERCYKCNRIIWNRAQGLYDSHYYEREVGGKGRIGHIKCKRGVKES